MTLQATWYKCREDNKWYADPVWYGEDKYTILMDEDGEIIFINTKYLKELTPEQILTDLGIGFSNLKKVSYVSKRYFLIRMREKFFEAVTYTFTLTDATIPKPNHWYNIADVHGDQWHEEPWEHSID